MTNNKIISEIKLIIEKWGSLTTADLETNQSPVYSQFNKDHFSLIERFNLSDVEVITYIHETEVDSFNVSYEDLDEDMLYDIFGELETYDIMMDKTIDSCRDEDWN